MTRKRSGTSLPERSSTEGKWLGRTERLLASLAGAELAEAILGDLAELRPTVEARWGRAAAWLWLVSEIIRGAAALAVQRLRLAAGRRKENRPMDNWSAMFRRVAAAVGLITCLPAAMLVIGGLLQSEWSTPALRSALERTLFNQENVGFRILIHPATILTGLALAAGLNLIPLLRVGLERRPGTLVGTLALRVRAAHLGVAVVALGLLGLLLAYGFTENFRVVPTHVSVLESGWQYTAAPAKPVMIFDRDVLRLYVSSAEGSRLEILRTMGDEGTWQAVATPPANED